MPPECGSYHRTDVYPPSSPGTFPLLLEDSEFSYDVVDNPIAIKDWRLPSEWPVGAKPVSRSMVYDDLYRLSQIDYQYSSGNDTWVSPFAAEVGKQPDDWGQAPAGGLDDPRRAQPSPHVSFDKRVRRQTYAYDWLGNTTSSDDDAHGFYDRSLGTITNGGNGAGPYQLTGASNVQGSTVGPRRGDLSTKYDAAGNLIDLAVNRATPTGVCLPAGSSCYQRFLYTWDEVGRLSQAQRWDAATMGMAGSIAPTGTPAARLHYSYDGLDQRVLKTAIDEEGDQRHTAYLFGSLELRQSLWSSGDYEYTSLTEVGYLLVGGVRLAQLYVDDRALPIVGGSTLHVLLELGVHLGSASTVLDLATSELAERMTYTSYGATESDYRPSRWGVHRDDYHFTGKEEDIEIGLVYFGKRFLNVSLGRWASADPLTVHALGADLNAYAYVQGTVLKAVDPVGLDASPRQEKADLSGAAVNGVIPDRVLVIPGQKGYTGVGAADYEKFRSSATIEYVHDPKALPVELKKITALLGDGAKPDSKAASEIGYLGALISGQGQQKDAEGASVNGIVGGTNPNGIEGKGWQVGVGSVQIAAAVGIVDSLLARGVGTIIRGIGIAAREVRAMANIGHTFEDGFAKGLAKDLQHG